MRVVTRSDCPGGHNLGKIAKERSEVGKLGNSAAERPLTGSTASSKLNHMVKYQPTSLDRTFSALADPTRRALLAQLDEHENVSVSELARPFPVSLPAIMKHLDVLSGAGLIIKNKTGRTVSLPARRGTHGGSHELVQSLPAFLVGAAGPSCRVS